MTTPAAYLDRVFIKSCASMAELPGDSIDCIVTSPPYETQRHYSDDPEDMGNYRGKEFIEKLRAPMREAFRVLRPEGSAFFNFQHGRAGGFASTTLYTFPALLEESGFKIVQALSWLKVNAQPSADPRLLKSATETIFHVAKSERYFTDKDSVRAPSLWAGRDKRAYKYNPRGGDRGNWFCPALDQLSKLGVQDVLRALLGHDVDVLPMRKAQDQATVHPAKMPDEVADWLILYGSRSGDTVLDPWTGSGTTLCRAKELGRRWVGYELSPAYAALAEQRIAQTPPADGACDDGAGDARKVSAPIQGPNAASVGIDLECLNCKTTFKVRKRWQVFCSSRCRYTHYNRTRTRARGIETHGAKADVTRGGGEGSA